MYCPKCGNKLPDGVSTCENCGWSEDAGIQTSKATTKPSPKKVIIAIIAVEFVCSGQHQRKKTTQLLKFVESGNQKKRELISILLMI